MRFFQNCSTSEFSFKRWIDEVHEKAVNEQCLPSSRSFDKFNMMNTALCCVGIFAFLLFSFFVAKRLSFVVPTTHMDGAFQTTSGLFRLQNGEVPGRDFYPYLGVLPIYLCYPFFCLAGGNVSASVFASCFVVLFCCMFSLGTIHFLISRKKNFLYSMCCGSALTVVFYLLSAGVPSISSVLHVQDLLFPGNSLRPIRQFAPYLCVLGLYFLFKNIGKYRFRHVCTGALWVGLFSLWSNDYSLGTLFLAGMGCCIWILTSERHCRRRRLIMFVLVFLIGVFFFYELVTLGNMKSLILYNFRDVARDQYWYFEPLTEESRVYSFSSLWNMFIISLSDLILPFVVLLILFADFCFSGSFGKICLFVIGCILFSGGLIATVGGHSDNYFRYFFLWGVGAAAFYALSIPSCWKYYENTRMVIALVFSLAIAFYGCFFARKEYRNHANAIKDNNAYFYAASLGGYLPVEWKAYLDFLDENRNKSFLEEYWGIASAYLHRNSDWKVDSVIHAFNKTREESSGRIMNKDYIITSSSSLHWTFWNLAQNYWLYEKVFHGYDFLFSVSDSIFVWKKRNSIREFPACDLNTCHLIDHKSFKIESPGMYEIHLDYDYSPRFHSLLVLASPLEVNHSVSFPPYQNQYVFLVSCSDPKVFSLNSICNSGTFKIKSVTAKIIPDDIADIFSPAKAFYLTDGNWERGYYKKSGGFFVRNTKENGEKYITDRFILLPDGSTRKITRVSTNGIYLNVFTEGDSFVPDIFPHQLDVTQRM